MEPVCPGPTEGLKTLTRFSEVAVIIPSYKPDERLSRLVRELLDLGFEKIVVVNDGSGPDHQTLFDTLDENDSVTVCEHATNRGKGAALKTGFRYVQDGNLAVKGVVTADADGQHLPQDIGRVAEAGLRNPDKIVLGSRNFASGTPLRSKVGNLATASLMRFVHGIGISDTQTGLRYLPRSLLADLGALSGDGYEFELQSLITAKQRKVELIQVPIETVYIDDNASSHFRPIVDSARIYSVLFRFGGSSIACFAIDIAVFAWIFWLGESAMFATICARTISGIVNFVFNKYLVFRSRSLRTAAKEGLGYLALWLVLMLLSGSAVSLVGAQATGLVVAVKILVDVSLFLLSYYAQSRFVFAQN
jgi:glycosyltransferase involved in cell wall biosynthesis